MAKASLRWQVGIGVILILTMAGCFRPAGDSVQPTAQGDSQLVGATSSAPVDGTPLPPITLIAPPTSDNGPTALPVLTLVTVAPATATIVPTLNATSTVALQVITPGLSLGLLTPDATRLPTQTPEDMALIEVTDEAGNPVMLRGETVDPLGEDECIYVVEAGDSLYSIAVSEGITVADLRAANPDLEGDPPILQIDQELQLPACIPGLLAEETDEVEDEDATLVAPDGGEIYVVRSGDTLGAIASRYGVTVRAIMQANGLTNPDTLSLGQELIIPPRAN